MPNLLDKKSAAQMLNISPVTLDRLRQRGQLPFRQIGRQVRFLESDLLSFIEASTGSGWNPKPRINA